MKDGGVYCKVGGKTQVELVREAAEGAAAVIAIGSCASWGGIQSADPNPTGAVGTQTVIPGKLVINVPGCPPSPYNFLSTVLYLLTFNRPPELDQQNRPKFAVRTADPRELRAAAAFRCRAIRARVRRRRTPPGLLPLQDRLQGSGDLCELPRSRLSATSASARGRWVPGIPASAVPRRTPHSASRCMRSLRSRR